VRALLSQVRHVAVDRAREKLESFLVTLPGQPFQQDSSLNAASINDYSLHATRAMKRLKELASPSPSRNRAK
jgi:hypothetical protein